jgi:CelD/BcsL family acetyltransferase involved in cellulose biosynthesis
VTTRVETISERARFDAIADAWDEVAATTESPFLLHCWLTAWWDAFAEHDRPRVLALWDDERLAGAIALTATGRRRAAAPANSHSPLFAPMATDPRSLAALFAAARDARLELTLPNLSAADPAIALLKGGGYGHAVLEPLPPVLTVELRDDYAAYVAESRWRRKEGGRLVRKMRREHAVSAEIVVPPEDLDAQLEEGFRLEASGWKGDGGTAILSAADTTGFYRSVAAAFAARDELRLSSVHLDGELAAWELCIVHAGRLHALKAAFDERRRSLGMGMVLSLLSIERAYELGLRSYELGPGEEDYKRRFANESRDALTLRLYPQTATTLPRLAYRRVVRPRLRRVARSMRGKAPLP